MLPLEAEQNNTRHHSKERSLHSLRSSCYFVSKPACRKSNNSSQLNLGLFPLLLGLLLIIPILHHSKVMRYYCKIRFKFLGIDFSRNPGIVVTKQQFEDSDDVASNEIDASHENEYRRFSAHRVDYPALY